MPVVVAIEIVKRYGDTVAVDGVSLEIEQGEIFGIVGPNGAGKTTTIECIEGLRRPDSGTIRVLGLEPGCRELRARIGVQLQTASLQDRLKVREAVELYVALYPRPADPDALAERLGLTELRHRPVAKLSGGQRQRLFIALALAGKPEIVFLDELTTGLDPHARRAAWDLVREIRAEGSTVVLSTHLMDEAEVLCDRVAVLDRGRVVACGSPGTLNERAGKATLEETYLALTGSARWE